MVDSSLIVRSAWSLLTRGSLIAVQLIPFLFFLSLMLVLNWLLFTLVAIHRAATGQTFTYPMSIGTP